MQSAINSLTNAGIRYEDAVALRRISMTLHRWHELECGDGNNYASWSLVRGRKTGKAFEYDDNGKPYMEVHSHTENTPAIARFQIVRRAPRNASTASWRLILPLPHTSRPTLGDARSMLAKTSQILTTATESRCTNDQHITDISSL